MADLIGYMVADLLCALIAAVGLAGPNLCVDEWEEKLMEDFAELVGELPEPEPQLDPLFIFAPVEPSDGESVHSVITSMKFDGTEEPPTMSLMCNGNVWAGWLAPGGTTKPGMRALWVECGDWKGDIELVFHAD